MVSLLEWVLLVLCLVLCTAKKVTIMTNTKEVTLTCDTSSPWFFCVWEGPGGDRACALRQKMGKQGDSLCGEQDRLEVKGNSSVCSLVIENPSLSDHGDWTCAVSDDDSLDTVKDNVELEIVVEGTLVIMPGKVELSEGEQVEMVCRVEEVFPPPEISWIVSKDMMGTLDTSFSKETIPSSKSHLVTIQHRAIYTPSHLDHGMNISCRAMQGNRSKQVQSLVSIVKKPQMKELTVENHVDYIAMISVSGVLIILLISVFLIISIKIRKKRLNKYDLKDIECENDQKNNHHTVEEEVEAEDDPKEMFLKVFPDDIHNKSVSSEESTKYSDSVDDDVSHTDHTRSVTGSEDSV